MPDSAADRAYFYDTLSQARAAGAGEIGLGADTLEEVLPNHQYSGKTEEGSIKFSLSDLVVVGRVTDVRKGEARAHTGDDSYRVVDFDDPEADERSLVVTVDVAESFGESSQQGPVEFRLGLAGADDSARFLSGVQSLGEVAIVLARSKDGKDAGWLYPALGASLMGDVKPDGSLSFPALGSDEKSFLSGVDTLKELSALAKRPATVTAID